MSNTFIELIMYLWFIKWRWQCLELCKDWRMVNWKDVERKRLENNRNAAPTFAWSYWRKKN